MSHMGHSIISYVKKSDMLSHSLILSTYILATDWQVIAINFLVHCFRRYNPESHCMLFHLKEIMLFSAFILQDFFPLIISHRSPAVSQGIQLFIKIYTTQNHFFLKIDLIKFTVSQEFHKNSVVVPRNMYQKQLNWQ